MHIGFREHYFKDLAQLEAKNFWFCARNDLIIWALSHYTKIFSEFLEIGCGTGFVISAVSKKFPNSTVIGSEYLEGGLIYARERVPDAQFIRLDAREIPYKSKFDVIGIFDVLEHIEDDQIVLNQAYKALKPGGCIYITVPQHQWLWSSVDDYACHVRRYSNSELIFKLNSSGFVILRSTSFVVFLLPAMYLSRLFQKPMNEMSIDDIAGLNLNSSLNAFLKWLLNIELKLIRLGVSFPVGGSRLIVARKPIQH